MTAAQIRYARSRVVADAVAAIGHAEFSIRTPRQLAHVWTAEARTLRPRFDVTRVGSGSRWYAAARTLLDWCAAERLDPLRVVSALFDYARVRERRGRPWWPYVGSVRCAFTLRLVADWEARQRATADRRPAAVLAGARRTAAGRGPVADLAPAVRLKRPAVRRRVAVVPRNPARTPAAALRALDAVLAVDVRRLMTDPAAQGRDGADLYEVVDADPAAYSPVFRVLIGCQLDGDADDRLALWTVASPEIVTHARAALADAGLPLDAFVDVPILDSEK